MTEDEIKKIAAEMAERIRSAALFTKARQGRRPIRVHNLVKKASEGGQDLRMPVMGGTKPPTDDSKRGPHKLLQNSSADVGPMASPKVNATLEDVSPVPKPKWASAGVNMNPMDDDPLVQYLQKEASKESKMPPLTVLIDAEGFLGDNIDKMLLNVPAERLTTVHPDPKAGVRAAVGQGNGATESTLRHGAEETEEFMEDNFSDFVNSKAIRPKYTHKDHEINQGSGEDVVNRVLGLK